MLRFWLGFIFFILAVPLIPFIVFGELPGESWVEHPSSTYVFFVGIIVLGSDIFLPIPSSLIAVFLGARLGFQLGVLAIVLGLTLSSAIGYYSGWYFGYPLVNRYVSEKQRQIVSALENKFSYLAIAVLRSVPVLAEASILGAGAARFRAGPLFLTVSFANLALALVYAFFGSAGQESSSPTLLFLGGIIAPTIGFMISYFTYRWTYASKR